MKRLTVVASVLLLPTFIVGLYGQNVKGVPEYSWAHGYLGGFSRSAQEGRRASRMVS